MLPPSGPRCVACTDIPGVGGVPKGLSPRPVVTLKTLHLELAEPPSGTYSMNRIKTIRDNMITNGFDDTQPLYVFRKPGGKYTYVIDGNHRLVAARKAGLSEVSVVHLSQEEALSYGYRLEDFF